MVPAQPPAGYHTLTTRVAVADVAGQVRFLREVFGATGEVVEGRPAEIRIGDSLIMVSSDSERGEYTAHLYVYADDADSTYERALIAGATSLEPPFDTPYGDRRAMVRDPYGNVFQIAVRLDPS
jgi:uncharacterized glyoxalase superfamily protein PhnB